MLVIAMIGILFAGAFYMWGPYISRSRDVTRFTDLQEYGRVIDVYFKDYDTIPSNVDSGGNKWFCAEEVFFERTNISTLKDSQFGVLTKLMGGTPRRDPSSSTPRIAWCNRDGSYFYSKIEIGDNLYSLIGARMSIQSNGNYLSGSDIGITTWMVSEENLAKMQNSYKWTISDTSEWSMYYFVATKH